MNNKFSQKQSFTRKIHSAFSALLFMGAIAISYSANAAKVVYEDVGFVKGTEESSTQFSITQAGTYEATLIDFVFPATFDLLSFQLTAGSPSELFEVNRLENAGKFTFEATAGTYYANLLSVAGGAHEIGLYGLQISQLSSVVPLPPAILLFLSSALVLVLFGFNGNPMEKEDEAPLRSALV